MLASSRSAEANLSRQRPGRPIKEGQARRESGEFSYRALERRLTPREREREVFRLGGAGGLRAALFGQGFFRRLALEARFGVGGFDLWEVAGQRGFGTL